MAADQAKLNKMQNDLGKWVQRLQLRADILGAEEFQDFLDLSHPDSVELRLCKRVLHQRCLIRG